MVTRIHSIALFQKLRHPTLTNHIFSRISSSTSQSVFLEKCLEEPIIVIAEEDDVDIIGPPDAESNLRPVIRKQLKNETVLQQKLRQMHNATQLWNQKFWAKHNKSFIQEKQNYINKHQRGCEDNQQLSPEEISEFYKYFLDKNWESHVRYNLEWYKRNFTLLFLALRVNLEKSFNKST